MLTNLDIQHSPNNQPDLEEEPSPVETKSQPDQDMAELKTEMDGILEVITKDLKEAANMPNDQFSSEVEGLHAQVEQLVKEVDWLAGKGNTWEIENGRIICNGRFIYSGEFGEVYEAFDREKGKVVAVKKYLGDGKHFARAEYETINAVSPHPNIIQVYDFIETPSGDMYMIMDFVPDDLRKYLNRNGNLSIENAIPILQGLAEAMQHLHEKGILHRDINVNNVLMSGDGPILTDFGIASGVVDAGVYRTMYFSAPEIDEGVEPNIRTEIYSLGVVAYKCITGCIERADWADSESLSPEAITVFNIVLNKDPNKRYESPTEFVDALKKCVPMRQ